MAIIPSLDSLMCKTICMFLVRIAYDKGSGRSRGFGFVDFAEEEDALSAKDAMDGKVKRKYLCCVAITMKGVLK